MATIQERIKELRLEKGYTQEELAKLLGLNAKSNIANYENGANSPSDKIKSKMCEIFDCSMDYLMGKSDYKNEIDFITKNDNLGKKVDEYYDELTEKFPEIDLDNLLSYMFYLYYHNQNVEDFLNKKLKLLPENYRENTRKLIMYVYNIITSSSKDNKPQKKMPVPSLKVPIIGKITAGQPILTYENIEGYLPVDPNIYGLSTSDELFYLRVSGQSMNLKIKNGDYALIRKQDYAEDGDIIVAIVNGTDEATLKRYKKINDEFVMLEPMSTYPMEPIIINLKETNFKIIGKAIGYFGKF